MPTRRLSEVALAILALAATGLVVGFGVSDTKQRTLASEASSWRGLVGGGHADVDVGQRELVVLRSPSMAQRVAMNGGVASERKERHQALREKVFRTTAQVYCARFMEALQSVRAQSTPRAAA